MDNAWVTFLILLGIFVVQASCDFIYSIGNRSLHDSWKIRFTLFANSFDGVIFHSFDSKENQFSVFLTENEYSNHKITKSFNNIEYEILLIKLCGCDPCHDQMITISMNSYHGNINVTCNNRKSQSWMKITNKERYFWYFPSPPGRHFSVKYSENFNPSSAIDLSKGMFLMIGNIGPLRSKNNQTIMPIPRQLVGCLTKFLFNDQKVLFQQIGTKVSSSCPRNCFFDSCHGGLCEEGENNSWNCDCFSTALNGPFCTKGLHIYNKMESNSYSKVRDSSRIRFKMSWSASCPRMSCLMELIGRNHTLSKIWWTSGTHLLMDSTMVANITCNTVNFFSIIISDKDTTISINNENQYVINETLDYIERINIGFSKKEHGCKTFQGNYDLLYDSSQMRLTTDRYPRRIYLNYQDILVIAAPGISIIVLFLVVASIVSLIRIKRQSPKVPDDENVPGMRLCEVRTSPDFVSHTYTSMFEENVYYTALNANEDFDEYMQPNVSERSDQGPALPPRNDVDHI